jgi:O-antigen ligase
MTTNLVISSGRTGYAVYFGSLFILLFTYYKATKTNILQLLIFPISVFMIGYYMNADVRKRVENSVSSIRKINQNQNYDTSFGARLAAYPIAYDILSQPQNNFILGMGVGDIRNEIEKSNARTGILNIEFFHLHNSYLEAYVYAGVFALILLLMIFYNTLKLKFSSNEMNFIKQLIVITIGISILSDVILSIEEGMLFFSIFVSSLLVYEKYERSEISK